MNNTHFVWTSGQQYHFHSIKEKSNALILQRFIHLHDKVKNHYRCPICLEKPPINNTHHYKELIYIQASLEYDHSDHFKSYRTFLTFVINNIMYSTDGAVIMNNDNKDYIPLDEFITTPDFTLNTIYNKLCKLTVFQ